MNKLASYTAVALMVLSSFNAPQISAEGIKVPSTVLSSYSLDTPSENVFTLEDDLYTKYILLDSEDDGFLVMSDKVYDEYVFDGDAEQKFNPSDENNIAKYLNGEFFNENISPTLKPYIIEHEWKTEGGNSAGSCPEDYAVSCAVSLLSYTEYNKYIDKFGAIDNDNQINWWLRTGDGSKPSNVIAGGGVYASRGKFVSTDASAKAGIRPIFFLSKDFFSNVRVDIYNLGKNVRSEISRAYCAEELKKAGYTDIALKKLGIKNVEAIDEYVDIMVPNAPSYMQDHKYSYFEVDITHGGNKKRNYKIQYSLDGGENFKTLDVKTSPKRESNNKIWLRDENKGILNLVIRVYSDEGLVAHRDERICLIDYYKDKPLDMYSKIGIEMHHWRLSSQSDGDIVYLIKNAGFKKVRESSEWQSIEKEKGVYRMSDSVQDIYIKKESDAGLVLAPFTISFGNQLRTRRESSDKMYPPNDKEGIDAYVEFGEAVYKNKLFGIPVESFEIWNEPNLSNFWKPEPDYLEYSQLLNASSFKLKKLFPNTNIMAVAVASQDSDGIFDVVHRNNMIMYADEISLHPYTYPYDPDVRHVVRVPKYLEKFEEYGGWMDVTITEVGWPTYNAYNTTSYENQAEYLVKTLVYSDEMGLSSTSFYESRNAGLNTTYVEHGFGIFEYSDRPKNAVPALSQFNNVTADALYQGEFSIIDGARSFVYQRNGKPHIITWMPEGEGTYTLKDGEYAEDINGNRLSGKTIVIGKSPVYIFGVSKDCYAKAMVHDVNGIYDELNEKFGDKFDLSALEKFKETIPEKFISDDTYQKYLDEYFNITESCLNQGMADSDMSLYNTACMSFILYKKGESLASAVSENRLNMKKTENTYNDMKNVICAKKGDEPESALMFTDAMMRFADRFYYRAQQLRSMDDFEGRQNRMAVYSYLTNKICRLAEEMIKYEEPDPSRALFTYSKETTKTVYQGGSYTIPAQLENLRQKDFEGYAVWVDEEGNELGEKTPLSAKSGETVDFNVSGTVPVIKETGKYIYKINYVEDGRVVKQQEQNINFKSLVDFELIPSDKTLSGMNSITVRVKNTFDSSMKGIMKLDVPEGWEMETSKEFELASGETKEISFAVNKSISYPFNEYGFTIHVEDENGREVARKDELLNFHVFVYSGEEFDPESFSGDITGWEDSYPIYIEAPENPSDINSWFGQNRSVKMLGKWNENNLYILADVYDTVQNNTYSGFEMWNGDSIQIAFDSLLNGLAPDTSSGYREDDYEFGFGITPKGQESYVYYGPEVKSGAMDINTTKIIRNDDYGITRYLIRVPKNVISNLKLENGKKFGFNICANDADVLLREGFSQYTLGIGDKKSPQLFSTFTLAEADEKAFAQTDKTAFFKKLEEVRKGH